MVLLVPLHRFPSYHICFGMCLKLYVEWCNRWPESLLTRLHFVCYGPKCLFLGMGMATTPVRANVSGDDV
jgi:hypothetical protein